MSFITFLVAYIQQSISPAMLRWHAVDMLMRTGGCVCTCVFARVHACVCAFMRVRAFVRAYIHAHSVVSILIHLCFLIVYGDVPCTGFVFCSTSSGGNWRCFVGFISLFFGQLVEAITILASITHFMSLNTIRNPPFMLVDLSTGKTVPK